MSYYPPSLIPAAPGLVLRESHAAAASATLDFTTFYSALYDDYLIEVVNLIPANDAVQIYLRMSVNGGATYDAGANYSWNDWRYVAAGQAAGGGVTQNQILILGSGGVDTLSNNAVWSLSASYRLVNPGSAVLHKQVFGQTRYLNAALGREGAQVDGTYEIATAVNAFRILASAGNLASGTVRVYGLAK